MGLSNPTNALELELGIGYSYNPFYGGLSKEEFPDQYDSHIVGVASISHTFIITEKLGIKVWGIHNSLLLEYEPHDVNPAASAGLDMLGTSLIYKIF